jgi:predicted TIM-barrel fold metal-dependent hydrolase
MDDLPIVDAHHHLWDLARNHYPWLMGEPKHGTFLGDYSAIKHTYMPAFNYPELWLPTAARASGRKLSRMNRL